MCFLATSPTGQHYVRINLVYNWPNDPRDHSPPTGMFLHVNKKNQGTQRNASRHKYKQNSTPSRGSNRAPQSCKVTNMHEHKRQVGFHRFCLVTLKRTKNFPKVLSKRIHLVMECN